MRIGRFTASGLICASVFALGTLMAAPGQEARREKSKESGKPPALKLTLTMLESSVCSDRPLSLELQIENVGREEIKIDRADLWSSFSYGYLTQSSDPDRQFGRGGGMSTGCSHCRGNFISLLPGTARWEKHEFRLHEFFQEAGDYSLLTRLRYKLGDKELDVESNKIEFEVRSCGSN